jgi:hypothetical protein
MSLQGLTYLVVFFYTIFVFDTFAADPPCIAQGNEKK